MPATTNEHPRGSAADVTRTKPTPGLPLDQLLIPTPLPPERLKVRRWIGDLWRAAHGHGPEVELVGSDDQWRFWEGIFAAGQATSVARGE